MPWKVVDPGAVSNVLAGGPQGRLAKTLRRTRAVNPAAAAARRAKLLLFAPEALVGETPPDAPRAPSRPAAARAGAASSRRRSGPRSPTPCACRRCRLPAEPVGYLRIWAFDSDPDAFIAELLRVIPLLPPGGLIIDVRGNPGGYILAAEHALQLFTPKHIEPVRFSVLATPFTRDMARAPGLVEDLAPWQESLDAAVRNGELYAQPVPISDPDDCNAIGQRYGGPVLLVGDTNTYSAGDLFAAGFVDNDIGPFVCVGEATGAGGANVWDYAELRKALAGTPMALPPLASGIGLSLSFRRATRAGPSEGLTIEDVGVAGMPYAMTRNDLLAGNGDLLMHCVALLRRQPSSALERRGRQARKDRDASPPAGSTASTSSSTAIRPGAFRSPRAASVVVPFAASTQDGRCGGIHGRLDPAAAARGREGVVTAARLLAPGGSAEVVHVCSTGSMTLARSCR